MTVNFLLLFALLMVLMVQTTKALRMRSQWQKVRASIVLAESPNLPTEKFNRMIDLESEKVAHFLSVNPGEKAVLCRCWQSKKFPYCDGAHLAHNKRTGDNLGPCIITAPSPDTAQSA